MVDLTVALTMTARTILSCAGLAVCVLFVPKVPRLIWNETASAPIGLYTVSDAQPLRRGELVLAEPPKNVRQLAAKRAYLPLHVLLVKRVAALSGDRICSVSDRIEINGRAAAIRLAFDSHQRVLPAWHGCRRLAPDDVFLLMAGVPNSFDGRYFGPVKRSAVLGKLRPVWLP